jgi:hypothetical protein
MIKISVTNIIFQFVFLRCYVNVWKIKGISLYSVNNNGLQHFFRAFKTFIDSLGKPEIKNKVSNILM